MTSTDPSKPARAVPGLGRDLAELQRFTDAALAHLALEDLLAELLTRITEILHTDTAAILLLERGELHARAAKGIEEEVEQGVRIPLGMGFAGRIAAERRAIFIPDVEHADIFNPLLREKGIKSLLGVPLLIEGRVLGVLHVGSLSPREFDDADAELLQVAADRAALAIDHAILYAAERTAREEADRAVGVMRAVQRITDAALATLSLEDMLAVLLERISGLLGSDTAAILLLDDDGRVLRARAAKGIEEEVEQGVRVPVGKGFAGRIAAERRPIFLPDVDHADVFNPILREKGIKSLLGAPLLVEGRVIGVLHVGTLTPREFTDDDADLLQVAADRAALAIDHAQAFEQHRLTEALQHALLPQELIDIPGVEAAARYLPAAVGTSLGGDWYDVFPLGDGRIAMVVGDVVGRGVEAASLMAQIRTALRAYAFEGHAAAQVVDRVNGLLAFLRPATMVTASYLVLDPEAERLAVVSAGHPPPLVIDGSGAARFLDAPSNVALGVTRAARYTAWECDLAGRHHDRALHRRRGRGPRRIARRGDGAAARAGRARLRDARRLLRGRGRRADRQREARRRRGASRRARRAARRPARDVLAGALRGPRRAPPPVAGAGCAITAPTTTRSTTSPSPARRRAANAVEHAYAPGVRTFEVDAALDEGVVTLTVRDHGQWRSARGRHRGRGLPIMEALMDSVEVEQDDHGTVVVMRRTLGGRA